MAIASAASAASGILLRWIIPEIRNVVMYKEEFEPMEEDLKKLEFHHDKTLCKFRENPEHPYSEAWVSWFRDCKSWCEKTTELVERGKRRIPMWNPCARRRFRYQIQQQRRFLRENILGGRLQLLGAYLSISMVELLQKQVKVPSVGGYERQPLPAYIAPVEEQVNTLVEFLLDENLANKWVGIWGMGGSGKTLLARLINNDERVYDHFAGRIYFVIAGSEANPKELQKKLCHRLGCAYEDGEHEEETKSRLFEFLRNKRSLIILDDVWKPNLLEAFDVLEGSNGSKMLITTCSSQVLDSKHAARIRSGLLAKESSIKLFSNFAFKEGKVPEGLRQSVEEMAGCCKGLPLALKVMGGAMAGKTEPRQWARAIGKLKANAFDLEAENQLHHLLKYSYEEVQTIERGKVIQECFLCMAAFPEDARIPFAELVAWWRGEDLIGCLDEGWDDAQGIVDVLVARSLIEPVEVDPYDVRGCTYQIHDVLRKLILVHISVSKKNQEEHERGCLFLAREPNEAKLEAVLADEAIMRSLRKISLISSEFETLPSKAAEAPFMKTLLLNNSQLATLNSTLLGSFNNLKVLGLRFTTRVKFLPEEIGILNQLQVLDLYQSSIEQIPECVYGMGKLRYLDLDVAKEQPGIRNFEFRELHKLSNLEVFHLRFWFPTTRKGKGQRLQLEAIGSLTGLTSLALISQGGGRMSLPPSMTNLVNLRYLDSRCDNLDVEDLQSESPAFTKLETCTIGKAWGFGKEMLRRSNRLQRFKLQLVGPFSEDLSHELQHLRDLELTCDSLPESFASPSAFPSLSNLTLKVCTFKELPDFKPGALPKLSNLTLDGCNDLLHLPQSITVLPSLADLQVTRGLKRYVLEEGDSNASFIGLQRLEVTDTKIKYLPRSVATSPRLESILLYFNRELRGLLPPLEEERHVEGFFPSLTSLRIMDSNLTLGDIPEALRNRPKLTIGIS